MCILPNAYWNRFNTLFLSHDYHSVVALMVRIFKVFSHSNFNVYNTVLLITVTMLYNRCLELIPHITGNFYLLNNISSSPICPSCRQPPFCSVLFPILPLSEIIHYSQVSFNNRNMSLEMCHWTIFLLCKYHRMYVCKLDGVAYYTPRLCFIVYCSQALSWDTACYSTKYPWQLQHKSVCISHHIQAQNRYR